MTTCYVTMKDKNECIHCYKEMITTAIEKRLIAYREEATTKWSSDVERIVAGKVLEELQSLSKELGVDEK